MTTKMELNSFVSDLLYNWIYLNNIPDNHTIKITKTNLVVCRIELTNNDDNEVVLDMKINLTHLISQNK